MPKKARTAQAHGRVHEYASSLLNIKDKTRQQVLTELESFSVQST